MAKIQENAQGQFEKNKRWHKRRKSQLLPDNFDALSTANKLEALRGVVIVQARIIESLLDDTNAG